MTWAWCMGIARLFQAAIAALPIILPVAAAPAGDTRPNIIVIVADDLGYGDLGALGSEIRTPTLDDLARRGTLWTQFRASPACSPSRAMLLTGADHHRVGYGNMLESMALNQFGQPGYEGHLTRNVPTVAELLRAAGYRTYMVGKWHLGFAADENPAARGFQRSFAMLHWGSGNFSGERTRVPDEVPSLRVPVAFRDAGVDFTENGVPVAGLRAGSFSSDEYVDRLLGYIDEGPADVPFFGYLAFNAPHVPIQAPDAWRDRYRGQYDRGPAATRDARIERARRLGAFPARASVPPLRPGTADWESLDAESRRQRTRVQEVYAAMVEHMDAAVGHLFRQLDASGRLRNTVIVFLSDNGAAANETLPGSWYDRWIAERFDNSVANLGDRNSEFGAGRFWAQVGSGPFRSWKLSTYEGGIRVPLIVAGPSIRARRDFMSESVHIVDVVPTILDFAGVKAAPAAQYRPGRSLRAVLEGRARRVRRYDEAFAFEYNGNRAVVRGSLKAVWVPQPRGAGKWELFDIRLDPGETIDLASRYPGRLLTMQAAWNEYAASMRLILPDVPLIQW